MVRQQSAPVRQLALALRDLVLTECEGAVESFYGGQRPMAMYRTDADLCWIQPLKACCNFYLMHGPQLSDAQGRLQGTSDRYRYIKIKPNEDLDALPLRDWLQDSQALNRAAIADGPSVDDVHRQLQHICLGLPRTKETITWGKPHFRVGEKIFCGCGEDQGKPRIGLKLPAQEAKGMMRVPGITKAPYSRPGDGWISIEPHVFDDWDEIARMIVSSYCLIAPKRLVASLELP